MTVKELIAHLQAFDQDAIVIHPFWRCDDTTGDLELDVVNALYFQQVDNYIIACDDCDFELSELALEIKKVLGA